MAMEKENLSEGDVLKKTDDAATRIRARIAARAAGAKEEKTEQPAVSSDLGGGEEKKSEFSIWSKEELDELEKLVKEKLVKEKEEKPKDEDEIAESAEPVKPAEEVGLENEILEGEAVFFAPEQAPEKLVEKPEEMEEEMLARLNLKKGQEVTLGENFNKYSDLRGKSGKITGMDSAGDLLIEDENGKIFAFIRKNNLTSEEISKNLIFEPAEKKSEQEERIKKIKDKKQEILDYFGLRIGDKVKIKLDVKTAMEEFGYEKEFAKNVFGHRETLGVVEGTEIWDGEDLIKVSTEIVQSLHFSKNKRSKEILEKVSEEKKPEETPQAEKEKEISKEIQERKELTEEERIEADIKLEEFENDLKRYKALKEEVLREEEREAAEERISQDVLNGLNSFGISGVELAEYGDLFESFSHLTHGQQLLALQNLGQARLGMIEEAAQARYEEETGKMTFAVMVRKWLKGDYEIEREVVKSLKEKLGDTKESVKAAAKSGFKKIAMQGIKEKEAKYTKEGLAMFGEDLGLIIKQIQDNNIDVSEHPETGKLEINFFSFDAVKDFSGFNDLPEKARSDFQDAVSDLNQASQALSKMPYEWSVESAKPSEKRAYKKAEKYYKKIKEEFLDFAGENMLESSEIMQFLNQAEYSVYINQFLNTNPDIEAAIKRIDSPNLRDKVFSMSRVLTSTVGEKVYMAGLGFGARALTAATVGAIGFPVAAFAIGAMTARRRGKEMLLEKTKKARRGKEEGKREKEILLIKNKIKDLSKELKGDVSAEDIEIIEKIKRYKARIKELKTGKEGKQIIFEKASVLNESLEDLINDFKNSNFKREEEEIKAAKNLIRLRDYTEAALTEGLIDFGEIDERIKNQYDLMRNLAGARVFSGYFSGEEQEDINKRLDEVFGERNEVISETEKKFLRNRMLLGGLMSAAFFEAGYYIRHHFWEKGGSAGRKEPSFKKEAPPTESPSGQKTPKEMGRERRFPRRVEELPQEEKPLPQTKEREGIVPETKERSGAPEEIIKPKELTPEDLLKEMEDELNEFEKESGVDKKLYGLSEAEAGVIKDKFSSLNAETRKDFIKFFKLMPRDEKLEIIKENGGGEKGEKALFEHILKYVAEQKKEENILHLKSASKLDEYSSVNAKMFDASGIAEKNGEADAIVSVEKAENPPSLKMESPLLEKARNELINTDFIIKKGGNLFNSLQNLHLEKKEFNEIWNQYEIKINGKPTGKTAENFGWISENTKVVLDGKNKTINLIPEKGGVVKTNEEYLENLEKRGKKAPEWLQKLRKEVDVEEKKASASVEPRETGQGWKEKHYETKKDFSPEIETKKPESSHPLILDDKFEKAPSLPLHELSIPSESASQQPKAPELESKGLSAPPQIEQINEELLPYLKTEKGVPISERVQFIFNHSEFIIADLADVKKIFEVEDIINKNLNTNFNSQQIYDNFFKSDVKIIGFSDGKGVAFEFENETVSIDENGNVLLTARSKGPIISPLTNNVILEKVSLNEFLFSTITELKNNIPARVEAENEIMSALRKLSNVKFGFDVSQNDLTDMLRNKTINDVWTEKWARSFFLDERGPAQITKAIRNWFRESGITIQEDEEGRPVSEILSKYALELKDSVVKTGLTQKKVK